MVLGLVLSLIVLGSIFAGVRYGDGGVIYSPNTALYFPSTMLHNTVPLQDVEDTMRAMQWLDDQMDTDSSVIIHYAFLSWARLYLDRGIIIHYVRESQVALNMALERGVSSVYLVWWGEDIQWYDHDIPRDFVPIFSSGRISVSHYRPSA